MFHRHKWIEVSRMRSHLVGGPQWEVWYECEVCWKSRIRFEHDKIEEV